MQVRSFWIENIIFYTQILNFLRHTHMFRIKWNHYNNIQCSRKNLYVHKSPAPSHQTFSVSQIHSFHNSSCCPRTWVTSSTGAHIDFQLHTRQVNLQSSSQILRHVRFINKIDYVSAQSPSRPDKWRFGLV